MGGIYIRVKDLGSLSECLDTYKLVSEIAYAITRPIGAVNAATASVFDNRFQKQLT